MSVQGFLMRHDAAIGDNVDILIFVKDEAANATAAAGAIRVGDEIAFALHDSALLAAMTAPYVAKRPVGAAM